MDDASVKASTSSEQQHQNEISIQKNGDPLSLHHARGKRWLSSTGAANEEEEEAADRMVEGKSSPSSLIPAANFNFEAAFQGKHIVGGCLLQAANSRAAMRLKLDRLARVDPISLAALIKISIAA